MRLHPLSDFVILAALSFPSSHAVESTRMVVLQLPATEVAAVRAELNEAAKTLKPETMDAVMKRRGVSVLAEFKEQDPWRGQQLDLRKETGEIKFGNHIAETLGVLVPLHGMVTDGVGTQEILNPEIKLPATGKSYRGFQNAGNTMILRSGKWTERSCWGDGKQMLMLWQYPVVEKVPDKSPVPGDGRWNTYHVEMLWFRAPAADIPKAVSSKPETRDKALAWLNGRAKLWKEGSMRVRKGDRVAWIVEETKLELTGEEVVAEQDMFSVDGELTGEDDALKIDWTIGVTVKSETTEHKLAATVAGGHWHFLPVEGVDGANVVACRFRRE